MYVCYLLQLHRAEQAVSRSYIGITSNLVRRIRQHNGDLAGGATTTTLARGLTGYCTFLFERKSKTKATPANINPPTHWWYIQALASVRFRIWATQPVNCSEIRVCDETPEAFSDGRRKTRRANGLRGRSLGPRHPISSCLASSNERSTLKTRCTIGRKMCDCSA